MHVNVDVVVCVGGGMNSRIKVTPSPSSSRLVQLHHLQPQQHTQSSTSHPPPPHHNNNNNNNDNDDDEHNDDDVWDDCPYGERGGGGSSSSLHRRHYDLYHHHRLYHKGKTPWAYWWSVLRVKLQCRIKCLCLLGLGILFVAFVIHRMVALTLTTKEWAPSPIQFIERDCPQPTYETLEQVGQHVDPSTVCLTTLTDQQNADWFQSMFKWRQFNDLLPMTWPNKQAYATKHGYQLYDSSHLLDNSRPPSWSKIKAVQHLLSLSKTHNSSSGGKGGGGNSGHASSSDESTPPSNKCEWVVWWDADTVIMNSDKRIHDIFPVDGDLIITKQKVNSYNAGAWIIKNTPWSHSFLQTWWDMDSFVRVKGLSVSGDNDALFHYLTHDMTHPEFQQHVVVPPRCTFNSVTKWVTPSEAKEFQQSPHLVPQQEWYMHEEYYHKGDLIAHVAGTYSFVRCRCCCVLIRRRGPSPQRSTLFSLSHTHLSFRFITTIITTITITRSQQ